MSFLRRLKQRIKGKKLTLQARFPQYEIGRASYGNPVVRSWKEGAVLRMGSFCSIAAGVKIFLGGEHRTDWVTTFPFSKLWPEKAGQISGHPKTRGDVVIGNDVWIGAEAVIMSGVRIGHGAVVGTRALVTRDIPPYAIAAGNPATVVRMRFPEEAVNSLLEIAWWEWPDEKIARFMPLLLSDRIDDFIQKAKDERFSAEVSGVHSD